jgi:ABC-type transport system involved in cytochrome c biogenesis ATPase subunit
VPHLSAGSAKRPRSIAALSRRRLENPAEVFGLPSVLDREAAQLSRGQQRRLARARAMASRQSLRLVDEPEGGLDNEALCAWQTCMVRALEEGNTALKVAPHRPLAFDGTPLNEVRLLPGRA